MKAIQIYFYHSRVEILDPSLGDLESSVQMNFMVDIGWVLSHYYFAGYL